MDDLLTALVKLPYQCTSNDVRAMLSSSDFGQIRSFAAVAEALSFTRAAERLGVTSQALSQTVRALEERIGVRLLHRTTRSVSLTEAGEELFRQVGPAIGDLGAALERTRSRGDRPTGTVRLHSFRIAADLFIAPALRLLQERCPEVVLDVTLDDHVLDVVAGRYDASLQIGEVIERDMVAARLGPELRQVAVASPAYLTRHGAPEHPRDLVRHRCIGWRWPGHDQPYRWEFQDGERWFEVAVAGPLLVNSRDFAVAAAVDGIGIAFAIEEAVASHVAAGRLVPLLHAWSAPFPGFFLCYPAQRQMPPALRAVIDTILATARHGAE